MTGRGCEFHVCRARAVLLMTLVSPTSTWTMELCRAHAAMQVEYGQLDWLDIRPLAVEAPAER